MTNSEQEHARRIRLADYAHQAWTGWMRYLFEKSRANEDGSVTIPSWAVERWQRQMNTSFADLPTDEQASDFIEADRMIEAWQGISSRASGGFVTGSPPYIVSGDHPPELFIPFPKKE